MGHSGKISCRLWSCGLVAMKSNEDEKGTQRGREENYWYNYFTLDPLIVVVGKGRERGVKGGGSGNNPTTTLFLSICLSSLVLLPVGGGYAISTTTTKIADDER